MSWWRRKAAAGLCVEDFIYFSRLLKPGPKEWCDVTVLAWEQCIHCLRLPLFASKVERNISNRFCRGGSHLKIRVYHSIVLTVSLCIRNQMILYDVFMKYV